MTADPVTPTAQAPAPPETPDFVVAVAALFGDAAFNPGSRGSAVTPLAALAKAQGVIVDEVPNLTPRAVREHLLGHLDRRTVDAALALSFGSANEGEPLAGYLHANRAGGWILVNRDDRLVRRRFTIAHEFGHYMLDLPETLRAGDAVSEFVLFGEAIPRSRVAASQVPQSEEDDDEAEIPTGRIVIQGGHVTSLAGPDLRASEVRANRFAADVLMPEIVCRQLVHALADRCGRRARVLARRLASEMLVSQLAMELRLASLGLADLGLVA